MKVAQMRVHRGLGAPLGSSTLAAIILLTACHGEVGSVPSSDRAGAGQGTPGTAAGGTGGASSGSGGSGSGGSGSGGSGSGPGAMTGTGTGTGGTATVDCTSPHAAAVRLQLLSMDQYNNTVLDMFQVSGNPANNFGDQVFAQLDDTGVELRANAAASVAQQAAATLSTWSPCTPPATGDATSCEQQIIAKVGANAFRHPLSTDESTQMKTLFDAGIKEKDFSTGVEWFLTGVLQSPDFMYEVVRPAAGEVVGQTVPLAPYEYASRLSYVLWASLPDDKLFAGAAANELSDATKRQVHLTRMMADARFMRGVQEFYSRWLNTAAFAEVARNDTGFTQNVVTALSTSLLMSATQLYSSAAPNFSSLFSGESYYLNDTLRAFYGVSGSGTAFTAVKMSGQGRQGILTHPGLMAMLARPAESNPISRGLYMLRTLMCGDIAPPPAGLVIPPLAPIQQGLSTRDRIQAHATNPACSGCHKVFDPPGFALENFDEVGNYRTTDQGKAVDTSGVLAVGNDLDGPFASGGELITKMANSPTVKSCFAQQYLKFALARQAFQPEDQCSAKSVGDGFVPSGDLKQLVVSLVGSDAFRMRLAEGVAP